MTKYNPYKDPEFQRPTQASTEIKHSTMILVPNDEFLMGTSDEDIKRLQLKESDWAYDWSDNDMFDNERPQHTVKVAAFEIGQSPVTNSEYYHFTADSGFRLPRTWNGFTFPEEMGNHPVTGISKLDALAYIKWLNGKTGQVYRLPTEAEWEFAARGKDGRIFPWGNTFDPWRCNTSENAKKATTPVGSYSPGGDSPFGMVDMVGNVWEWTNSIFGPYPFDPDYNQGLPSNKVRFVVRGGAWYYSRKLARCAVREGMKEDSISHLVGFRLAKTPA